MKRTKSIKEFSGSTLGKPTCIVIGKREFNRDPTILSQYLNSTGKRLDFKKSEIKRKENLKKTRVEGDGVIKLLKWTNKSFNRFIKEAEDF